MRRFRVWLDRQITGVDASEEIVEMPDDASDEECREECSDCLNTMISNELDTGWNEIDPKPAKKSRRARGTR